MAPPLRLLAVLLAASLGVAGGPPGGDGAVVLARDVLLESKPGGPALALIRAGTRLQVLDEDPERGLHVRLEGWLDGEAAGAEERESHAEVLFALHRAAAGRMGPLEAPGMQTLRVDTARPTVRAGSVRLTLTAVGRNLGSLPLRGVAAEAILRDSRGRELARGRGRVGAEQLRPGQETVAEWSFRLTPGQARALERRRIEVRWLLVAPP